VRTGGHACTQAVLLQDDFVPESATNKYTVRPFPSTRTWPSRVLPTPMVVPDATSGVGLALGGTEGAPLGEAAGEPYGLVPPLDGLPHATAISAAATAPPVKTSFERI
jgi:hypothetical protein